LIRPRILLADDHPAMLAAVSALLQPRFEVVGEASDGEGLVSETLRLNPDVIVADITMSGFSGIDAVHQLREAGHTPRVVFLTVHSEYEFIAACLAEGASGYVLKTRMKTQLIPAIEAALAGQTFVLPFSSQ
jgi:DNA-binding NarL/FixJ family response regulator